VACEAVRIRDGFWATRQRVNGETAVPSGESRLETAGNLDNLRIAAGTITGAARGPVFMDSDVYKWLEAAAWEYARRPSPELLESQRRVTAIVAAAQQPDGYLDSVVQIRDRGERYRDLPWSHEHYCAGHLIQAAVAQVRCTGDRALLDVAVRFADHLVETFGPDRRHDVDGHPVVEMASWSCIGRPARNGISTSHSISSMPVAMASCRGTAASRRTSPIGFRFGNRRPWKVMRCARCT